MDRLPAPQEYDTTQKSLEAIAIQHSEKKNEEATDIFERILAEAKRDVRESIIQQLSNVKWGKVRREKFVLIDKGTKIITEGKKQRLVRITQKVPTTEETEDWVPVVPNTTGLMPLSDGMKIADYVADQVGSIFRTTYYDPNVITVNIAAIIAMISAQMLDNPRYDYFNGNETDSAAFALKVVSHVDAALKNSVGGFISKLIGESTTNVYSNVRRDGGDFARVKGKSSLESFFGVGKQEQNNR